MKYRCTGRVLLLAGLLLLFVYGVSLNASEPADQPDQERPKLKFADQFAPDELGFGAGDKVKQWTVGASFQTLPSGREGTLRIDADIAPGWHVYSVTQKGGPGPLKIRLVDSKAVEIAGVLKPNRPPHVIKNDPIFETDIEYHEGKVHWIAPIRIAKDTNPESAKLMVKISGQVCNDNVGCVPFDMTIPATFSGVVKSDHETDTFDAISPASAGESAKQPDQSVSTELLGVSNGGPVIIAIVAVFVGLGLAMLLLFVGRSRNRGGSPS